LTACEASLNTHRKALSDKEVRVDEVVIAPHGVTGRTGYHRRPARSVLPIRNTVEPDGGLLAGPRRRVGVPELTW
jgi:hypothetical protein